MPGTSEGRTPYDPALMQDAFFKADNVQAKFFFTWNVNTFVLFDRSQWNKPMIERRVKEWDLGLRLDNSGQCNLPEVQAKVRDVFLPKFFGEFAEIVLGRIPDWGMRPDEIFIRSLESHLDWPVVGTRDFLAEECSRDKAFASRLQEWLIDEMQWSFDPSNATLWRETLDRAARTLCYVFCNRAIFYDAVRAQYPDSLKKLDMPSGKQDYRNVYEYFRKQFAAAVSATGDYEPIFYPEVNDWVSRLVFASPQACQGWKGLLANLELYNFRNIPHDVIGGIFQKLIAPEERQKFGQYFTHEDIVDVINAFCIRRAGDYVLDPACGSGSFLVRAYHRKAWLSRQRSGGRRHQDHDKSHQELLREIYGCDIALFPAHLATLNLASRQILDEENYPLVRRGNFFELIERPKEFCSVPVPANDGKVSIPVPLEPLDAVVGNPPYVRQELIPKRSSVKKSNGETNSSLESRLKSTKEYLRKLVSDAWPGLKLSGRSDLHCYFWPIAAKYLKEGGYFGFLTSSSWLDVEYGFALQGWILQNFKLIAVIESVDEPWFEDARIKTCATVMQRCGDERARNENLVKFVRLQKPLADILGRRDNGDEAARQEGATRFRRLVETVKQEQIDEHLRIIPIPQTQLWQEGVEAGRVLAGTALAEASNGNDNDEENGERPNGNGVLEEMEVCPGDYLAGKWGRFVRAPDIYFRLMRDYGHRFVKLGEIAEVRFGIKSGCDAFFMPRDATDEVLRQVKEGMLWNNVGLMTHCPIKEVQSGKVRIVRAGDNTLHPIEAEYLRPEVHSLMAVDRPVIRAADIDRVVLWVNQPLRKLAGTYVAKYIRWGAKQTFASKKSQYVPVPERSTCAARPLWFDLSGGTRGECFWPKSQQYRHITPDNPEQLICNCNLYDIISFPEISDRSKQVLAAVLNSTLVALFKTYYGRYAGTEGNLKTEVVDVKLMQVPSPLGINKRLAKKISAAFTSMQARVVGPLVEEEFMDCHTVEHLQLITKRPIGLSEELQQRDRQRLDNAVLEMIGVTESAERERLLDELYFETSRHYRQVRIVEVQKQVQRAGGAERRLTAEDLAASTWDSLEADEQGPPLMEWLAARGDSTQVVNISEGRAKAKGAKDMFAPADVVFTQGKTAHHETYAGPEQAALVALLANNEIRGDVDLPDDEIACRGWRKEIETRLAAARAGFEELAASRTGKDTLRGQIAALMMHWFIHGRRQ
ncbi:MAG: N-6 DNA methylase [Pirellulales bacterium]|nr:N-6 DNA methylase [Pirellulales bacterium]